MRPVKVMFQPIPGDESLWETEMVAAFRGRHDLQIYDSTRSLEDQFVDVEVVVTMGGFKITREMIEAAKQAKVWQLVAVGYDRVDIPYLAQKGIAVCNCPGFTSSPGMAESAIMLILMLVKHYEQCQQTLQAGKLYTPLGEELGGRTLGLIGFGVSGQALAAVAKGFGLQFMITEAVPIDPKLLDEIHPIFVGTPDDTEKVFSEADIISLHLPLLPETRGFVNARRIGLMKPTALFINVARGDLVDQEALYDALLAGKIAGIGTDVYTGYHPDLSHPVFQLPNFIALPHISGSTNRTVARRAQICLENVDRVAKGLEPKYRVAVPGARQ